jgi:hypothetical protein
MIYFLSALIVISATFYFRIVDGIAPWYLVMASVVAMLSLVFTYPEKIFDKKP